MKKVKLQPLKALQKAVSDYRRLRAAGKIEPIELFEEAGHYFGKRGGLLKREIRYNKAKASLNRISAQYKRDWRGGRGPAMQRRQAEKQAKDAEKRKKQSETFRKNRRREQQRARRKGSFAEQARRVQNRYDKMLDVFKSDVYQYLHDVFDVPSAVVSQLLDEGWTTQDIIKFFSNIRHAVDQLPEESKSIAFEDVMWGTLKEMQEMDVPSQEEFAAYFTLSMEMGEEEEEARAFYEMWQESNTDKSFMEAVEELRDSIDIYNRDTWEEILDDTDNI